MVLFSCGVPLFALFVVQVLCSTEVYDFIIVGSGAGSVVAKKIATQSNRTVLLLDKGDFPVMEDVIDLALFFEAWEDPKISLNYSSVPQPALYNRMIDQPRAAVGGGCTSHNEGIWFLGDTHLFDVWADKNPGWSWANMSKYYKEIQQAYKVTALKSNTPWMEILLKSAESLGYTRHKAGSNLYGGIPKVYSGHMENVNGAPIFLRSSSWTQFIDTGIPPNLKIKMGHRANSIVFENNTAIGVIVEDLSTREERLILANKEVIICGGTIDNVKLLMLSGIGPKEVLNAFNIAVVVDIPGVGKNFQDHLYLPLVSPPLLSTAPELPKELAWYGQYGMILYPYPDQFSPFKLPSYFLGISPVASDTQWNPTEYNALQVEIEIFQLNSTGSVSIKSTDPNAEPIINPHYLESTVDLQHAIWAFKKGREYLYNSTMKNYFNDSMDEILPGKEVQTDLQIENYLRSMILSDFHVGCTCKMGPDSDPMAVVNEKLQVRGVKGLRIVDASIMPLLPSGNMQIHTLLIGLKGADLILEDL